jgi:hypothetical protein
VSLAQDEVHEILQKGMQVGLDTTFHHVIILQSKHGSIDDTQYVHITNLTPGGTFHHVILHPKHIQLMTPSIVRVTNLTPPGSEQLLQSKHIQLMTPSIVRVTNLTPPGSEVTTLVAGEKRQLHGGAVCTS